MTIYTVSIPDHEAVEITVAEFGSGQPVLLLHGGAGPQTMLGFAQRLAGQEAAQVVVPTHPGFGGTPRPDWLNSARALAQVYVALLDALDSHNATLIGNSIGGWIAAEMAASGSPRIGRLILVNAVGVAVAGHPVLDTFSLSLDELSKFSFHNPAPFRRDPATMTEADKRGLAANRAALTVYAGGAAMTDPTLADRLRQVSVPTLVLWGASDRVVTPDYGRAFAAAIPGAEFQLLADSGHMPQIETPDTLLTAAWSFITRQQQP